MRAVLVTALCLACAHGAVAQAIAPGPSLPAAEGAQSVPLPQPRPPQTQTVPDGFSNLGVPSMGVGPEPQPPSACLLALTADLAVAEPVPPIAQPNGCDALDAVRLSAVNVGGRRVPITPPVTLRCTMATALATWVREDVAPAAAGLGGELAGIDNYDSFECRGRNRIAGAKTSEHGRANAIDIKAVLLAGGQRLGLTDPEVTRGFRETIRRTACARFTTVLGPGSDGYHEEHVHVDLAERRNGYRLCQWNVLDVTIPLPRPRPAEAPDGGE